MNMHLVWDWNGTLLDDLDLVVTATNAAFASVNGPVVSAEEHRRRFRRPIIDYYSEVLGRAVDEDEFRRLDRVFHDAYRKGLTGCGLATDAMHAIRTWSGTQSLLSMWFHDELVPTVQTFGLADLFVRVDGLRTDVGGDRKAEYLVRHLDELGVVGESAVLIGDSVDDAHAAAAVGASCVLYAGGLTHPDVLRGSGYPVAESLTEAVAFARSVFLPTKGTPRRIL
ncbi:MAG TPA: HAD hydrolase-like protein [Micromonosporaceae bacterium]